MLAVAEYVPVTFLIGLAAVTVAGILLASQLINPRRRGPTKDMPYESGMDPVGDARRRFSVRFYLVAVLFLIFDVEVVFLLPWAMLLPRLRGPETGDEQVWAETMTSAGYTPGFLLAGIGIFFVLLLVGFWYEWRKGVFKWN